MIFDKMVNNKINLTVTQDQWQPAGYQMVSNSLPLGNKR